MRKKLVALICLLSMILQLCTFNYVLANGEDVIIDSVVIDYSNGQFDSTVSVKGGSGSAVVIVAAYDSFGELVNVSKVIILFSNNEATCSLSVKASKNDILKYFVWNNMDDCTPLCEAKTPLVVFAEKKANGVSLVWEDVAGAESYDVYRDGEKIASVTEPAYDDIYFDTIEEIAAPYVDYSENHTYYVLTNGSIQSASAISNADLSLIKYITFDNATYTEDGINAGANRLSVSTRNADNGALGTYVLRERKATDASDLTSKYMSPNTWRAYNDFYAGSIGGQNALGLISYQYKTTSNNVTTIKTEATRPILDMTGFETQDIYTIIMNANIMVDSFTIAGVETAGAEAFSDKAIINNKVSVVDGEDITATSGSFNPGANKNKFTTYIYDMNTKFNGKYGDMRFSNTLTTVDETAAIRSVGVVKKSDFLEPVEVYVDEFNLSKISKANGVILNWQAVEGVSSYDIYKDGVKVSTVDGTQYVDVFYNTIEEIDNVSEHTYYIKADGKQSHSIKATADLSLIKYINL